MQEIASTRFSPSAGRLTVAALALALISVFLPAMVFGILLSLAFLWWIKTRADALGDRLAYRFILVAFLIRLPVILILALLSLIRDFPVTIFGDSRLIYLSSRQAFMALLGTYGPAKGTHLDPAMYGYSLLNWFFGAAQLLLGFSPLLAMLINILSLCLAGWLVYLITLRVSGHRGASLMALGLTLFMPSQIMWSINLLKEPIIILCLAVFIYLFVDMIERRHWWHLLILAVWWIPLGHLRAEMNLLALLTLLVSSLLFIPRRIWPGLAVMAAGALATAVKLGPARIKEMIFQGQALVVAIQNGNQTTGGSYYIFIPQRYSYGGGDLIAQHPMGVAEMITAYVKALYYYLASPSPFSGLNLAKAAVAPQMLLWIGLLIFFFLPGVLHMLRYHTRSSGIIIIYLLVFTSAMALFTGNEGTVFRQRDILSPFYFIPMSIGYFNVTGWLSRRYRAILDRRPDGPATVAGAQL